MVSTIDLPQLPVYTTNEAPSVDFCLPFDSQHTSPSPTASTASTLSCSSAFFGEDDHSDFGGLGISFAGGGWLMCYLFGVAKSLRRHSLHHTARFTGTSAGALAAIGLTLDADFDAINDTVLKSYVPQAHGSFTGPFQMRRYLVDALTRHANLEAYDKCNADPLKCTVVYTSLSALAPRRKSTFTSASHLLETLIASCCATPLVGLPFKFENEWVIDGGLTENQPLFQSYHHVSRVVNVSPNVLDTSADIRPSQYVPPWWSMYPPSADELAWVYALGQKDGHDWCMREGFGETIEMPVPVRPRVHKSVVGQLVGYQWIERHLLRLVAVFMSPWDCGSALALLQLELLVRRAFRVGTTALRSVVILWTLVIASAMATAVANHDLKVELWLCSLYVYVVICGFWMLRAFQRLHPSSEDSQLSHSLAAVQQRLPPSSDITTLSECSHLFSDEDHATLATHSLCYRLAYAPVQRKTRPCESSFSQN